MKIADALGQAALYMKIAYVQHNDRLENPVIPR